VLKIGTVTTPEVESATRTPPHREFIRYSNLCKADDMTATVVMVHGAWHGAWCFDRVLPILEQAGVRAMALDLPGHGDDSGPFEDLHGDAERVLTALDAVGEPVILLGHSYGGAVITEAGVHPVVQHLVYLAALLPGEGQSCMAAAGAAMAEATLARAARGEDATQSDQSKPIELADVLIVDGDTSTVGEAGARALFMNDCDETTSQWMLSRLGGQPMANMSQVPSAIAWRGKPATYVVCTRDRAVPLEMQRVFAQRCSSAIDWPTGHSPFASRPDLVAALLIDQARSR